VDGSSDGHQGRENSGDLHDKEARKEKRLGLGVFD
jgi:hypothetical protein